MHALDAYLRPGAILWFGEAHGTEESPRFIGEVVAHAAARGRVQLGLEIPRDEAAPLDAYLRSDGGPAARAALIEGAFWQWQDGRSSHAMVALIDRMRGVDAVELVAFDIRSDDAASDAGTRDRAMADFLEGARDPDATLVVLSGNVHSRCRRGVPWDPDFIPAAAHLVERGLRITTFDVVSAGGTYWGIVGDDFRKGVQPNFEHPGGEPWTLGPARDDTHHATYHVGITVASLPVR